MTRYGGPDELRLQEVEIPVPKDDEVLVKVHAVSVNDWDWALIQGDTVNRMLNGVTKPRRRIFGSDIAGRVASVGKGVARFKVGDEVFGDLSGTWGGFAEYVCAQENALGKKSPAMSFEEAASIPQAAMLAVQGLVDKGKVQAGQSVLINGAGGGVGTFGIQILNPLGVEITAVDAASKLDMLRSLGAARTIDYKVQDFTSTGTRYDVILDTKTNRSPFHYLRALKPGGKYITVGGSISRLLQAFLFAPLIHLFTSKKVLVVALKANKDLDYMTRLFESGQVRPVIDGPYTLEQTTQAFRIFAQGNHKGKIVITLNP